MHDVADFLRRYPPFDALADDVLERLSDAVEIEYHPRGTLVLAPGSPAPAVAYIVRTGEVEMLAGERVVDAAGPGEVVALGAALTGSPVALGVRASDDLLLYRVPADQMVAVLSRPAELRFVDPTIGALARPVAVCDPADTVAEAVRRMEEVGTSGVVVRQARGVGIVTDHDLRHRLLARGRDTATPIAEIMTPDAVTMHAQTLVWQAQLVMLERSIQHLPVVDDAGRLLGLVSQGELLAARGHEAFRLRRSLSAARDLTELVGLALRIPAWTCEATEAGLPVRQVLATRSVLLEALLGRLVDLGLGTTARPDVTWVLLGGLARREHFPGSDVDTALVLADATDEDTALEWAHHVMVSATTCGLRCDTNGVEAADPRFVRSVTQWQAAIGGWVDDPRGDGLTYLSALADARSPSTQGPGLACLTIPAEPRILRLLAHSALRRRPPTGFVRGFVVEHSGQHRGQLNLKDACLRSIVGIGRWAALATGSLATGTVERLRAGASAGLLEPQDAEALTEIADLAMGLRLDCHVAALRAGRPADDHLDPRILSPLTRRHLREAFRLLAQVQTRIENDLETRLR